MKAFDDTDFNVRKYAGVGAGRLKSPELLPKIIAQLSDPIPALRMIASGALAGYGTSALSVLGAVMNAHASEADPTVKEALSNAIRVISEGKK